MNEEQFMARVAGFEDVNASVIDELCWDWLISNAPDFGNEGVMAEKLLNIARELMS